VGRKSVVVRRKIRSEGNLRTELILKILQDVQKIARLLSILIAASPAGMALANLCNQDATVLKLFKERSITI
jgi:hypothetical protein